MRNSILILILLLSFSTQGKCSSDSARTNILRYYLTCQKADGHLFVNQYDSAKIYYTLAIDYNDKPNLFDIINLGICEIHLENFNNARDRFIYALKKGFELPSLKSRITSASFLSSEQMRQIESDYPKYRSEFYNSHDIDMLLMIEQLVVLDTEVRKKCNQEYQICKNLWDGFRTNNLKEIMSLLDNGKFPGFNEVGFYAMTTNLILLHGKSEDLDVTTFNKLSAFVREEVLKGNFSPQNYAYWVDGYHYSILKDEQIYGTIQFLNKAGEKVLYKTKTEKEINNARTLIGLESISLYAKKMRIKLNF